MLFALRSLQIKTGHDVPVVFSGFENANAKEITIY
jgi:hypothetical protein